MRFELSAVLTPPKLRFFGGEPVTVPVRATLNVGDRHGVAVARLAGEGPDGPANLGGLVEPFGVDLDLDVRSAGLFALSVATADFTVPAVHAFLSAADLPADLAELMTSTDLGGAAGPVAGPDSISLWVELELGVGPFAPLVTVSPRDSTLLLYASVGRTQGPASTGYDVAPADVSSARLLARLPSCTLLSAIRAEDVVVTVSLDATTSYSLAGSFSVDMFGIHLGFEGSVSKRGGRIDGRVSLTTGLEKPLTPLTGVSAVGDLEDRVTFASVDLVLAHDLDGSVDLYALSGTAGLGDVSARGNVVVDSGTLVLVDLVADADLALSALVDDVLQVGWSPDLVDLTVKAGSSVTYLSGEADPTVCAQAVGMVRSHLADVVPGVHVTASLDLAVGGFRWPLSGEVTLSPTTATASISLDQPVDIYFLRLADVASGVGGPTFHLLRDRSTSSMGLTGAVTLFGSSFGADVTLALVSAAGGAAARVQGRLTATADLGLIPAGTSLGFAYDSETGLSLTDWPEFGLDASQALDFAKAMRNAYSAGGCAALVSSLADGVLTSTLQVTPSFGSDGPSGVNLLATGTCDIGVVGVDRPVATIPMPPLSVALPTGISMDQLPGAVLTAVATAAARFLEELVQDPAALATVIGLLASKQAVADAAETTCRLLEDPAVAQASASIAQAVSSSAGAAGAAAGAAISAALSLAGLPVGGRDGDGDSGVDPNTLAITSIEWEDDDAAGLVLALTWLTQPGATRYRCDLVALDNTAIATSGDLPSGAASGRIVAPTSLVAGTYGVIVTAEDLQGRSLATTTGGVLRLSPPSVTADVVVAPDSRTLRVAWHPVPRAAGYVIEVTDPSGSVMTDRTSDHQYEWILPALAPSGNYLVALAASGAGPVLRSRLSAPTPVTVAALTPADPPPPVVEEFRLGRSHLGLDTRLQTLPA